MNTRAGALPAMAFTWAATSAAVWYWSAPVSVTTVAEGRAAWTAVAMVEERPAR